jgi:predicted ribosome quality control (RQC) complex YloA/Tae2 family protein
MLLCKKYKECGEMKRVELIKVCEFLNSFKKINSIERVDDTILKIVFDRKETIFFDLRKGDSYIFKKKNYQRIKEYNAPFDVALYKRFTNALISKFEVLEGNRVLQLFVESSSKYKSFKTILQFEFTGRNTNIIILDEDMVVIEALRHIDISNSFREVRVGVNLLELPVREFKEEQFEIEDIEKYLTDEYLRREIIKLESIKKQKISQINKKIKKLQKIYDSFDNEEKLLTKAKENEEFGNLVLANIYKIKNYQKKIDLVDFEGEEKTVILPPLAKTPAQAANMFFKQSKKFKQKAKYLYIERDNISSKLEFLKSLKKSIEDAKSSDEVNLYLPKQPKKQKNREKVDVNIESFFIEGYKISLGKNEKGNIWLLKNAKMSHIWMHLKDIASTHVIITTNKKNVPDEVLSFGAKLCVQFSSVSSGTYLVDYTQRRNVKMRDGANVNYVEYKTIQATKE